MYDDTKLEIDVREWVKQQCQLEPDLETYVGDLYEDYNRWRAYEGMISGPPGRVAFGRQLNKIEGLSNRRRLGLTLKVGIGLNVTRKWKERDDPRDTEISDLRARIRSLYALLGSARAKINALAADHPELGIEPEPTSVFENANEVIEEYQRKLDKQRREMRELERELGMTGDDKFNDWEEEKDE